MSWKVTTAPNEEPLTLSEAKAHLRVTHANSDTEIQRMITEARNYCEEELDLAIPQQTITLKLDGFPAGRVIRLPRANLVSVTSVKYLDGNGDEQTFSDYTADGYTTPARVVNDTETWPQTKDVANAVEVVYVAGFGTVPELIKRAMLLLIGHWYDNRGAVVVGSINSSLALAVDSALQKYRAMGV
jgi:uncharacterized phiE125 gp8 family phage protein